MLNRSFVFYFFNHYSFSSFLFILKIVNGSEEDKIIIMQIIMWSCFYNNIYFFIYIFILYHQIIVTVARVLYSNIVS